MGMRNCFRFATIIFLCGLVLMLAFSLTASAQSPAVALPLLASPQPAIPSLRGECLFLTRTMCNGLPSEKNGAGNDPQQGSERAGAFHRGARRILRDQEELWV